MQYTMENVFKKISNFEIIKHQYTMENVHPKNIQFWNHELKIKRNGISFSNAMDYTMEKVIPKSI